MIPANKSAAIDRVFLRYTDWYLARNFHAIYQLGEMPMFPDDKTPLIVCVNHSSWWDLLLAYWLARKSFPWDSYGVMDERQLRRYRFFTRLGVMGVDRESLRGAREFLSYCGELLPGQRRALWITPQGEMRSSYERPLSFQPGLGHLAAMLGDFYFVIVTLHYEFWNEPRPEAFVSLSPVEHVNISSQKFNRKTFVSTQERCMETQLDTLLSAVQQRDASAFQPLLQGKAGISRTYDAMRALSARLRGEHFSAEHSDIQTPQWKQKKKT